MIKEYLNILNKKEKDFLKKAVVNNGAFPFYLNTSDVDNNFKFDNPKLNYFPFFTHTVLLRPEQSDNANKKLTNLNLAVKENLKTYLSQYRLMTDAVNIKDAYIINIGLKVNFIARSGFMQQIARPAEQAYKAPLNKFLQDQCSL